MSGWAFGMTVPISAIPDVKADDGGSIVSARVLAMVSPLLNSWSRDTDRSPKRLAVGRPRCRQEKQLPDITANDTAIFESREVVGFEPWIGLNQ